MLRQEELTPELLQILQKYAMFLLGEFHETPAHELLLRFGRLPSRLRRKQFFIPDAPTMRIILKTKRDNMAHISLKFWALPSNARMQMHLHVRFFLKQIPKRNSSQNRIYGCLYRAPQ